MSGRSGEPRSLLSRTLCAAQAAIRLTTDGPEVHRAGGAFVHSTRWPSASAYSLRAERRPTRDSVLGAWRKLSVHIAADFACCGLSGSITGYRSSAGRNTGQCEWVKARASKKPHT